MKNVINCTPHAIVVANESQNLVIEPSGLVARIDMEVLTVGELNGFPIVINEVVGNNLPAPQEGIYLLVSAMVLAEAKAMGRKDCVAPNTNSATRNEKGHIVSVPGFVA